MKGRDPRFAELDRLITSNTARCSWCLNTVLAEDLVDHKWKCNRRPAHVPRPTPLSPKDPMRPWEVRRLTYLLSTGRKKAAIEEGLLAQEERKHA